MRRAWLGVWVTLAACADVGAPGSASTSGPHDGPDTTNADTTAPPHRDHESGSVDDLPAALARPDHYDARTDTELVVAAQDGVLANDDAPAVVDHDARTEAGGLLALDPDGALRYQPPAGWAGCDRARYRVGDDAEAELRWSVHGPGALDPATPVEAIAAADEGLGVLGATPGERLGGAVAIVGDMDGDGHPEVAVAAADADVGDRLGAGVVHVVTRSDARGLHDVALHDDDAGLTIVGDRTGAHVGEKLAAAGDIDGDGLADLLVAAPRTNLGSGPQGDHVGRVFVVFGAEPPVDVDLADLLDASTSPTRGQAFTGEFMGDHAGTAIAGAGDLDGDGRPDLVVGAPLWGPGEARPGRVYVIFSRPEVGSWRFDQMLASGHAIAIEGTGDAQLGRVVAGVGDLDGDGDRELAIGSPIHDGGRGRVWIVDGPVTAGTLEDGIAAGRVHVLDGDAIGDAFGTAIAALDDIDGDGRDDLAIGAPGHDGGRGRVWILGGDAARRDGAPALGPGATAIDGHLDAMAAGTTLGRAGDLDGDGHGDAWIGAGMADGGAGRAYGVPLGPTRRPRSLATVDRDGVGISVVGHASMGTARALDGGVDLDADGVPDAIIGSPGSDDRGAYSGRADIVPGAAVLCR